MPQLELGIVPLSKDPVVGMNVAFMIDQKVPRKRRKVKVVCLGRVLHSSDTGVVIEDLKAPGSRYNRPRESIFEVHKDTDLNLWVS
jgi:hypothetical protein